jgi:hypothetical protein
MQRVRVNFVNFRRSKLRLGVKNVKLFRLRLASLRAARIGAGATIATPDEVPVGATGGEQV